MRPAPPDVVRAALGAAEAWAPDLDPDDRYVDLATLVGSGLTDRVSQRLGGAPAKVGDSAVSMGVASRLWSLTVVPLVRSGVVVDPGAVVARDDRGAVVLGVLSGRGFVDVTPDDLYAIVMAVLAPLIERLPLSPRLHWGNVAGSLAVVPRVCAVPEAEPLVADLLARGPWAGLMDGPRRRTCCLFYLAPGAGLCGDCALDRMPT